MDSGPLAQAGLTYARRGWAVLPVRGRDKRPITEHGVHDATTDAERILSWIDLYPEANVGLAMGGASGVFALDIDGEAGARSLAKLEAEHGTLPPTLAIRTARGRHLVFRLPEGARIRNGVAVRPGIDVRSTGGYIVAPPSIHPSGAVYALLDGAEPADAPAWLVELVSAQAAPRAPAPQSERAPEARARAYIEAAVRGETEKVACAVSGTRNAVLNRAAYALGQLAAIGLDEGTAQTELERAAEACGLTDDDGRASVRKTIASGWAAGQRQPRSLPESDRQIKKTTSTSAEPEREIAAEPEIIDRPETAAPEESEIALAEELVAEHGADRRYVSKWSKWMLFDGHRWAEEGTLEVFDLARKMAKRAASAAENASSKKKLASATTVSALERLARSDRRVVATDDQWDRDPWLLNTPGGVIDLRTGEIRPALHEDYCTKITGAGPGGDAPTWRRFLGEVTGGDQDLQAYLRRVAGYALTGSTQEHALFFLFGSGANGKSVCIDTLRYVLGDFATTSPMDTFTDSSSDRHPTEIARLRGARLVTATETEEGRPWKLSLVKQLTGGDRISARFMRADFFEFTPQFKLLIAGNHKPTLHGADEAERRRFHLIPFSVTIPPEKRDPRLAEKLRAEAGGILGWMLEGFADWRARGLDPPAAVRGSTADYFEQEDALGGFLADACEVRPGAWEPSSHVFGAWRAHAEAIGEPVGSQRRLTQRLESRGFRSGRETRANIRVIRGLRLRHRLGGGSEG
jgi:P4 family phage/plasmid primase-like protien